MYLNRPGPPRPFEPARSRLALLRSCLVPPRHAHSTAAAPLTTATPIAGLHGIITHTTASQPARPTANKDSKTAGQCRTTTNNNKATHSKKHASDPRRTRTTQSLGPQQQTQKRTGKKPKLKPHTPQRSSAPADPPPPHTPGEVTKP